MVELGHVSQKSGKDIPLALIIAKLDFANFRSHFVPIHINVLSFTSLEFRMTLLLLTTLPINHFQRYFLLELWHYWQLQTSK